MADFDISVPSPDDGHEAIRAAVVGAIEELAYNTDDANLLLSLSDSLFALLDSALTAIDDLTARLVALENPAGTPL